MTEIVETVFFWVLNTWLVFAVLRRDERRLTDAQWDRAWCPASRLAAGVYFGVVCLPVHFWRTRRSLIGTLQGFAWGFGIAALDELLGWSLDRLVDSHP